MVVKQECEEIGLNFDKLTTTVGVSPWRQTRSDEPMDKQ